LKRFVLFILIFSARIYSYQGQAEVEQLFSKIPNICDPSLQDYRLIEEFLVNGQRPYLNTLDVSALKHGDDKTAIVRRIGRQLKLIGQNNEMPTFDVYSSGEITTKDKCILLYASYNNPYPSKVRKVLEELLNCGYMGDILVRIGGFPNLAKGGLTLCHIPYAWKVAFFDEARDLGYKKILWIDASMHPMKNLDGIFDTITQNGYLFLHAGVNLDHCFNLGHHLKEAINALNVDLSQIDQIPHITTWALGLNVDSPTSMQFLDEWISQTKKVVPCINWYPEELCVSALAWRCNMYPTDACGMVVCNYLSVQDMSEFSSINFFIDLDRE
jgi:hypothetical protein